MSGRACNCGSNDMKSIKAISEQLEITSKTTTLGGGIFGGKHHHHRILKHHRYRPIRRTRNGAFLVEAVNDVKEDVKEDVKQNEKEDVKEDVQGNVARSLDTFIIKSVTV